MKIEAVIISVNYSDFLDICLSKNHMHFDNIIVVTTPEDVNTISICKNYENVLCIKTDAFFFKGAKFNKGLAINVGLKCLKYKDWVVNLDSDTVLPENFRELFVNETSDIECSYGCRRYDVPTFKEWQEIEKNQDALKDKLLYRGVGYGNFFSFNYNSSIFKKLNQESNGLPYPYWIGTVAESDWIFRNYWSDWIYDPALNDDPNQHYFKNNDRAKNPKYLKQLSFNVIHLGETGRNESARVTKIFN
jgi:hypothetical protein